MRIIVLVLLSSAVFAIALPWPRIEAELVMPDAVDKEAPELEGLYLTRFQRQKFFEKFTTLIDHRNVYNSRCLWNLRVSGSKVL